VTADRSSVTQDGGFACTHCARTKTVMGEAIPTILTAFALYQDPRIVEAVARLAVESPEVAAKLVRAEAAMEQCAHIFAMLAKEAPA